MFRKIFSLLIKISKINFSLIKQNKLFDVQIIYTIYYSLQCSLYLINITVLILK